MQKPGRGKNEDQRREDNALVTDARAGAACGYSRVFYSTTSALGMNIEYSGHNAINIRAQVLEPRNQSNARYRKQIKYDFNEYYVKLFPCQTVQS